jgi:GNAT superfamily N-acetyltransferase
MTRIRPMTEGDVPLGMRLKAQAGWNQTEADWRRFLWLQPDGCFVAELDGTAVGTSAAFVFGRVGWVAVVLVDEGLRGRGVGTALTRHALAFLDGKGIPSARLDATPLGRPIYEKLGFVAEYRLARYAGVLRPMRGGLGVEALRRADLEEISCLDETVTRADRRRLLERLFDEYADSFRMAKCDGTLIGFLASRPGAIAAQIGPCLATNEDAGRLLLADAAGRLAGQRVLVDVPLSNIAAVRAVEAIGLTAQRELLRMGRGESAVERVEQLWASCGPEKG